VEEPVWGLIKSIILTPKILHDKIKELQQRVFNPEKAGLEIKQVGKLLNDAENSKKQFSSIKKDEKK